LHMAQLMRLPLTVSCFSEIQIGFTFLVPAHLGSSGKRAVKRMRACVCVCVCVYVCSREKALSSASRRSGVGERVCTEDALAASAALMRRMGASTFSEELFMSSTVCRRVTRQRHFETKLSVARSEFVYQCMMWRKVPSRPTM